MGAQEVEIYNGYIEAVDFRGTEIKRGMCWIAKLYHNSKIPNDSNKVRISSYWAEQIWHIAGETGAMLEDEEDFLAATP